jgi:catechol 2,3-dioxygenase-like lactoylglutathione lyase family enzyme
VVTGFDRITLKVPDLQAAIAEYSQFTGEYTALGDGVSLSLSNVGIVLEPALDPEPTHISGLTMVDAERPAMALQSGQRQIPIFSIPQRVCSGVDTVTATGLSGVDHVVLMTRDADDCIRLFGEELGMRLALDQLVPEWGGRMLFFRCGKMTLEIIHNVEDPPQQDRFWGITYLCPDLDFTLQQLDERGVEHSEVRKGRKPGTRVATVKSHNLGLPTMLIEPA